MSEPTHTHAPSQSRRHVPAKAATAIVRVVVTLTPLPLATPAAWRCRCYCCDCSRVVLHRFKFKTCPQDACFSPDGRYLAVTAGRKVEVWRTPGVDRVFSAFVLHRVYTGHYDDVTCVSWDPTSK